MSEVRRPTIIDGFQLEPPRRVTVVDSIIEQLVAQIHSGILKPGDRLPSERQLMEMLSVSRSSVREALQGLAAMDLVEGRAGEGTFVKAFNPSLNLGPDISTLSSTLQKEMRQYVNQARLVLEEGIAGLAAEQITPAHAAAILEALTTYEQSAGDYGPNTGSVSAHDRVHLVIAEATGNPFLVRILRTLLTLVPRSLRDKGLLDLGPDSLALEMERERRNHHELCEAVIRGDAPAAIGAMRYHAVLEQQIIDAYYGA